MAIRLAFRALCVLGALMGFACTVQGCNGRSPAAFTETDGTGEHKQNAVPQGIVTAHGGKLWLDGRRYRFVGMNVYSLASHRAGDGFQCGPGFSDDDVRRTLA